MSQFYSPERFDEVILNEIYIVEHIVIDYTEYHEEIKEHTKLKIQIYNIRGHRKEGNSKLTDYAVFILNDYTNKPIKKAHFCEGRNMNDEIKSYCITYQVKKNHDYDTIFILDSMKLYKSPEDCMRAMKNGAAAIEDY